MIVCVFYDYTCVYIYVIEIIPEVLRVMYCFIFKKRERRSPYIAGVIAQDVEFFLIKM